MEASNGASNRAQRLGQLVQNARQELGLTQQGLAERAGISLRNVTRIEAGDGPKRQTPTWAKLEGGLAWPLGFIRDYLAGRADETALAGNLRRDPVPEGDLTGMIHDVLFNVFGYAAPDVPLSVIRESERIALEVAKKHGYVPALRQERSSGDQTGKDAPDS